MENNKYKNDKVIKEELEYFGVSEKDYVIALKLKEEEIKKSEQETKIKEKNKNDTINFKKTTIGGDEWLSYDPSKSNKSQIKKTIAQFMEENRLFSKLYENKSIQNSDKQAENSSFDKTKIQNPMASQIKEVSKMIENTLNSIYSNETFQSNLSDKSSGSFSDEIQVNEGDFQNVTQAEFFSNYYAGGVLMSIFSACLWEFSFLIEKMAKESDPIVKNLGEMSGKIKDYIFEKWWNFGWKYDEIKDVNFYIKKHELGIIMDCFFEAIYIKQINKIRKMAIEHFKKSTQNDDVPADFAFFTADSFFVREAEASTMVGSGFSYETERLELHETIQEIAQRRKQFVAEKLKHAEQQANAFQYLQMQQAQLQAIQQQQFGGGSGNWNIGAAYRPPDSNLNISTGYQQGRTNIQISMVPDEQASLLGPNGFTSGVGPANLGLSLNLNL